jgi:hypothetical protein
MEPGLSPSFVKPAGTTSFAPLGIGAAFAVSVPAAIFDAASDEGAGFILAPP